MTTGFSERYASCQNEVRSIKQAFLHLFLRLLMATVIDLTREGENTVIDLTGSPENSVSALPDTSNETKKGRSKRPKKKNRSKPSTSAEVTDVEVNRETKSNKRGGSGPIEKPTSTSAMAPKRKRGGSVDSTSLNNISKEESKLPPPKRLKSHTKPHQSNANGKHASSDEQNGQIVSANDMGLASSGSSVPAAKADKKGKGESLPVSGTEGREEVELELDSKPPHDPKQSISKVNKRHSRSPPPSKKGKRSRKASPQPSSQAHARNLNSRRSPRIPSLPPSPTSSSLFYVDLNPNLDQKHIEDPQESSNPTYRMAGSLLLPEYVLLEAEENATPGVEGWPPPTPGPDEAKETGGDDENDGIVDEDDGEGVEWVDDRVRVRLDNSPHSSG